MFLWGGGWSALKILTQSIDMVSLVFWRFFLMSISFIPILYILKLPFTFNKHSIRYIFSSSILNLSFMVFSYLAIKSGLAGSGSVIITTFSPILTFVLMAIIFKSNTSKHQRVGLLLGLLGGFILLELHDISLFLHSSNIYFLFCALVWAGITILSSYSHKYIHPVYYSFFISLIATISSFLYAIYSDATLSNVFHQNSEFWIALIYLAVLGQSVATTIFFIASAKLGSQKTSSFMFLVPVFALLIAWGLLDEPIQLHIIIGGAISMVAVYFINKKI